MAAKKVNKLTSSNLKQIHSKTFTTKLVHIDIDNKIYDIEVDECLKVSKLQALISELIEKQKYLKDIEEALSIPNYIMFLIIKYFSNIDVAKVEDFSEQLRVFEIMLDLGVAEKILESIPESEMQKINVYIKKASDNIKKVANSPESQKELADLFAEMQDYEETHEELLETQDKMALNFANGIFSGEETSESEETIDGQTKTN